MALPPNPNLLNEATARYVLIDPALDKAGWRLNDRTQVGLEIPVDGYDATPWNGITDYCLYAPSGEVIGVIEAKRTCRSPREGEEQLRHYLSEIGRRQGFQPFGFMTNGLNWYFWDLGNANPRLVAGPFELTDLTRLRFIQENRKPLESEAISTKIIDRSYQHEAIRRVAETFAKAKRRALLVMATGTGKTRTTMALADLFLRTHQAQNILFLADREALVEQALNDGFKAHLPDEPRHWIYSHSIDKTRRLFVATLQTMGRCFEQISPAFFDVIVFDEAHRSIFNRFNEVIEYFDARMVGLTATPAHFLDRDTFRVFDCTDNTPTFLYSYPQAVREKHLVDFSLYQAQTGFQRKGIKGADLTEEDRNALIEQGIDPDQLDYSGTELEVMVSNKDTLRKQWEEIMEVCLKDRSGQLPGKTIVFAMTREHAGRIREVFEEMYPQHLGLIQAIWHGVERVHDGTYGDGLITKFKKNDFPRIAISVDMLDTGIDVPEVVNLIFMKPVQSRIKLWQMIGRGTRNHAACKFYDRLPEGKKTEFKIIDFWQNDFERKVDDRVPADIPVLVSVFNTRLKVLEAVLGHKDSFTYVRAVEDLRGMIQRIPVQSFPIRKVWAEVEPAWNDTFWSFLAKNKIEFIRLKVGPLLRFAADIDVAAETFTNKIERAKLQMLAGKASAELLASIADDVSRLPEYVHQDERRQISIKLCLSHDLAAAEPSQLSKVIRDLADQMKNRRDRPSAFLKLDLPDFVAARGYISIGEGGQQVYVEEYRKRVERRIMEIIEGHPTLDAIRQGTSVSDEELAALERTLHKELGGGEIELSNTNILKAYGIKVTSFLGFLRHILELEAIPDYPAVVARSFQAHITSHNYGADQIRFLRSVQEVFLQKRRLAEQDLYDPPLTQFGRNAVERFFTPAQIKELLVMTDRIAA